MPIRAPPGYGDERDMPSENPDSSVESFERAALASNPKQREPASIGLKCRSTCSPRKNLDQPVFTRLIIKVSKGRMALPSPDHCEMESLVACAPKGGRPELAAHKPTFRGISRSRNCLRTG